MKAVKKRRERKGRGSIRQILLVYALLFIVPIIVFLIFSNLYAIQLVRRQVYSSNKNTLYLYAAQIDASLTSVVNYLVELGTNDASLADMGAQMDRNERLLLSYTIKNKWNDDLTLYNQTVDGFFAYTPADDTFVYTAATMESTSQQMELTNFLRYHSARLQEDSDLHSNWIAQKVGDKVYLFRILKVQNVCFGTWVGMDRLLSNVVTVDIAGLEHIFFLDHEGKILSVDDQLLGEEWELSGDFSDYYLTGPKDEYLVVGERLQTGDVSLVALIADDSILEGLNTLNSTIALFTMLSALLILLFFAFSQMQIVKPFRKLVESMEQVEQGNLEVKLDTARARREFAVVNRTFNNMASQIKKLKIDVYEEKIQKQKAQFEFLQIQVNPHFFINMMDLLYNCACLKDTEMVKEMTVLLVNHFRYTLYSDPMIRLQEEIDFIHNYMMVQELRSAGRVNILFEVQMEEGMEDVRIPIMSIQTFVENAIKHGQTKDKQVSVLVRGRLEDTEGRPFLVITVEDGGWGFSEEVLRQLNKEHRIEIDGKKRIGIYNVKRRLSLLYGKDATITFANKTERGAVVTLRFPKTESQLRAEKEGE